MDFVQIFVLFGCFVLGWGANYAYQVFSNRKALSIMRQRANARGQEVQKEMNDKLMSFIEKMGAAWKAKPPEHTPAEFMLKDGGAMICLEHGDILIRYGSRLIKMVTQRTGMPAIDVEKMLGGYLPK